MRYMKSDLTLILGCVLLLAGCSASSKKADDAGAEATPVPAEVTDDYGSLPKESAWSVPTERREACM